MNPLLFAGGEVDKMLVEYYSNIILNFVQQDSLHDLAQIQYNHNLENGQLNLLQSKNITSIRHSKTQAKGNRDIKLLLPFISFKYI